MGLQLKSEEDFDWHVSEESTAVTWTEPSLDEPPTTTNAEQRKTSKVGNK